jgi:secreted PhoX family phosphatase
MDLSTTGSGALRRPSGRLFERDFRGGELAGVAFHGDWLFFNIQRPGVSFAVTGPWGQGGL